MLVLVASGPNLLRGGGGGGGRMEEPGGRHDLLLSGKKRTNSAMGTGRTPPQNAICRLLGWTVKKRQNLFPHTHIFFSWNTTRDEPGEIRVGGWRVREASVFLCKEKKKKGTSLFSLPVCRLHTAFKKIKIVAPKRKLYDPPHFPLLVPPAGGLDQKPSTSLQASVIPSTPLQWIQVILHPHRC